MYLCSIIQYTYGHVLRSNTTTCLTAERIELFLELFGNTLIRAQTSKYLEKKCDELIQ